MLDIGLEEAVLFFRSRISIGVESVGFQGIVIIVAPLCEVVGEFKSRNIC